VIGCLLPAPRQFSDVARCFDPHYLRYRLAMIGAPTKDAPDPKATNR
jgi:hypothetical protein